MSGRHQAHAQSALAWLERQDAPESALAPHELETETSKAEAQRWVRRIVDGERDGAWDGDLMATALALLTLRELREAASLREQDPAIGRALDWVTGQKRKAGAWTDGCDRERHRQGFCIHFAGGFFSPGVLDRDTLELVLPSGAVVQGENAMRFVASTTALRSVLLWRGPGTDARLHLDVLRRLVNAWGDRPPSGLTTTELLEALRTLVASPDPGDRDAAEAGLRIVSGRQRGDGSWIDADPFHALAAFHEAAAAGITNDRIDQTLDYGARLLAASQAEDGSWGPEHGARRALIGLRILALSDR